VLQSPRIFRYLGSVRSPRILGPLAAAALLLAPGRGGALTLEQGFDWSAVASGLDRPTAARFAPDGRLFILEKAGRLRLWTPGAGLGAAPALVLPSCDASEMGLLGLAFDPAFATNGHLYLYHTEPPGGDLARCGTPAGRENRVVRVTVSGDRVDLATLRVLFAGIRTDNGNHDGGELQIGPDGYLYVGVGDAGVGDRGAPGAATNPYAQDRRSPNGKILRLALDGTAAPGNPFAGLGGAADAVWAYGLRNPWRFTFQPGTGLLWVADVGQNAWEEIDVVRAGDNLGWPQCEGTEPRPRCPGTTVPPVYQYAHRADGASVTGGVFYPGGQFAEEYRGSYFFGDFVFDLVWRAVPRSSHDGFQGEPEVFARQAEAPVDFTVGPDGGLYYVAFGAGEVRRITQTGSRSGPDPCTLRLGRGTAAWLSRSSRLLAACTRREGGTCLPPAAETLRPATARLARTIARRCATPPRELCTRLACTPCATASDLAACAAPEAVAAELAAKVSGGGRSPCAAAVLRGGLGLAAARQAAIAACRRRGTGRCAEPARVGAAFARLLRRRCRTPPAALCEAFGCRECAGGAELAACVAGSIAASVDTFAFRLYGSG
jgi:glucose/arabinose dehydrogenase